MEECWLIMYFCSFFNDIFDQRQHFIISLRSLRNNFISANQEVTYMNNDPLLSYWTREVKSCGVYITNVYNIPFLEEKLLRLLGDL